MTEDSPVIELPVVEKVVDKMEKVRAAKKRKSDERDTTLTDMKKQIADMATMMSSSAASPAVSPATSDGAPAPSPEISPEASSEPVIITKQVEEEEVDSAPSFRNECLKSAMVGVLGLGTWYATNVLFASKAKPVPVPVIKVPESKPIVKPKSFIEQQPNSFLLPARKRKIGASGLLE